jgi:hypothetical protein
MTSRHRYPNRWLRSGARYPLVQAGSVLQRLAADGTYPRFYFARKGNPFVTQAGIKDGLASGVAECKGWKDHERGHNVGNVKDLELWGPGRHAARPPPPANCQLELLPTVRQSFVR